MGEKPGSVRLKNAEEKLRCSWLTIVRHAAIRAKSTRIERKYDRLSLNRELNRGCGPELAREAGKITIEGLDARSPMR